MDEVTGKWRKLHNEELNDIRMIKSRMRWAGYEARMGDRKSAYRVFGGET
jgi:hypothetical protein